jgi:hypothetical protein
MSMLPINDVLFVSDGILNQIPPSQDNSLAVEVEKANIEEAVSHWMGRTKHLSARDAEAVRKVCQSHPVLEAGCKKTSEVFSNVIETISEHIPSEFKEKMTQMAENRKQNIEKETAYNEQVLGIPAHMTQQFHADLPGALLMAGVILPFGGPTGGKGLSKLIKREKGFGLKEVETAKLVSRTSETSSISNSIVLEANKPWRDYAAMLQNEKSWDQTLKSQYPSFSLSEGLPTHINQFFSSCETHPFKNSGLGISKKGSLEGHLLYVRTQDNIFFVIKKKRLLVCCCKK